MVEASVARQLLDAARRDEQAFRALVALPEMNDAAIGFHAHQSIEKAIKAVLAQAGIAFRRTHDLGELLDLLSDAGHAQPPEAERLDELNPYAVEARYGLVGPGALDRAAAMRMVILILAWAQGLLPDPPPARVAAD